MDEAFPEGLDPYAARVLAMARAGRSAFVPEVAERRKALDMLAALADEPCEGVTQASITLEGPAGALACCVLTPADKVAGSPPLLYLHGGGWTAGGIATHAGFCGRLAAAAGAEIYLLDYRLAPEHAFPAALDDAKAALSALQARFGTITLAGDSAGATLALALAAEAVASGAPALARLLLIAPITDVARQSASRRTKAAGWFVEANVIESDLGHYLPAGVPRNDPRVSPLHRASFVGFPPVDLHLARFDPFFDEGASLGERLTADGVPVRLTVHEGMIHYFWCLPRAIPYARTAARQMGTMLRAPVTT